MTLISLIGSRQYATEASSTDLAMMCIVKHTR